MLLAFSSYAVTELDSDSDDYIDITYMPLDQAWTFAAGLNLGADSDAGDYDIKSLDKLEFYDTGIYIDGGADGYLDLEADTAIRLLGPTTSTGSYDATISTTAAGGETGIYSYPTHITNALTGTLIALRGSARVNAIDSSSGTVIGGKFQAGNMGTGTDLGTATGVYAEVVNKIPSGATTWTNARAFEANLDLDQGSSSNANTITNAYMFYGNYNLPTAGSYSTVTNGYGVFIRNEAVGGTGQMLDAAFYVDNLNHSGGIKGWDYGIDFNGIDSSGFGTADIRGNNGETIDNNTNGAWDFSAADLTTTGSIRGALEVVAGTGAVSVSAAQAYGSIIYMTTANEVTLPDVCDSATGAYVKIIARDAEKIEVVVTDTSDAFVLDGTALTANDELDSAGGAGDYAEIACLATNLWYVLHHQGTWVDGGVPD